MALKISWTWIRTITDEWVHNENFGLRFIREFPRATCTIEEIEINILYLEAWSGGDEKILSKLYGGQCNWFGGQNNADI